MLAMLDSGPNREMPRAPAGNFAPTHWSLVLAAGGRSTPESEKALAALCATYWHPVYAYIRRRGYAIPEAEDLSQSFFTRLLEKNYLGVARRERGKFRSFLLTALNHFLANEWDRAQAQKRGGGRTLIQLEVDTAEGQYRLDEANTLTPEKLYEKRWALALLGKVLARLEEEFAGVGKVARFNRLKVFLTGAESQVPYCEVAAALGMSEGAVKVAVHRLRQRFRSLLRAEIAQTIDRPDDPGAIDDEIRYLLAVLGS